jgi:cold shock protein
LVFDPYKLSFQMPKGTVKWFNTTKGYGFIQPQSGGKDIFVHISAVERAGLSSLNEGQVVQYEEVSNRGRVAADNLRVSR